MKTMKTLLLFDNMTLAIKKLVLDCDITSEEAGDLAHIADELNDVRENYINRKLENAYPRLDSSSNDAAIHGSNDS